jgi:predicted heme/steroid binding protein
MESFYTPTSTQSTKSTNSSSDNISTSVIATPANTEASQEEVNSTQEATFTKEELSKYNGQNGTAAYVAVDGIVYDMSSVFKNGSHFSHIAGTELTNAFYSYHAKSAITKYPVVGKFTG